MELLGGLYDGGGINNLVSHVLCVMNFVDLLPDIQMGELGNRGICRVRKERVRLLWLSVDELWRHLRLAVEEDEPPNAWESRWAFFFTGKQRGRRRFCDGKRRNLDTDLAHSQVEFHQY